MEKATEVPESQPQTGTSIDAPSYFTQQPNRYPLPDEAKVSEDKAKPPPKGLCKWLGKTPWNRKGTTQARSQTNTTSTSTYSLPDARKTYKSSKSAAGGLGQFNHHPGKRFFHPL